MLRCHRHLVKAIIASLLLLILLNISRDATAGIYTSSVVIVGNDIAEARQRAIREILQEVAFFGDLEIRTATVLIDYVPHERTLLDSRFRIGRFEVTREIIDNGKLILSAHVEAATAGDGNCPPVFRDKHIGVNITLPRPPLLSPETLRDISAFTDLLVTELAMQTSMIAQAGQSRVSTAPYGLLIKMLPGTAKTNWELRLDITGPDGKTLISHTTSLDTENLQSNERISLGYASLRRRIPTTGARQLAQEMARSVSASARCLPAIVHTPIPDERGLITLQGLEHTPVQPPLMAFFARRFPVTPGGSIDLLLLDGVIEILGVNDGQLHLRFPQKLLTPPGGAPHGFILLI